MASSNDKKLTTVRIPQDVLDGLDAEAVARGWSRSALLVHALAEFLKAAGYTVQPANMTVTLK